MGQQQPDQQAQDEDADRSANHRTHAATSGRTRSHSSLTSGSSSRGSRRARSASYAGTGASRVKAQAAAARTSGETSSSRRCAAATRSGSAGSPLPIAISTLRTNRSRPVRLIAVPAKSLRNAASSSSASVARCGAVSPSRGRKSGSRVGLGEFVPRTHREAVVAPVDPIADQRPQLERDHPLVLDRQIRDAAPGIEPVGCGERHGRADIEAALAGPAMVGLRRVGFQSQAQIDLAEKQPGAEIARHQIGVLALPAEPGALGERLLHDRSGVDKELKPAGPARFDPMRERFQTALQGVVIVAPLGVHRNCARIPSIEEPPADPVVARS